LAFEFSTKSAGACFLTILRWTDPRKSGDRES